MIITTNSSAAQMETVIEETVKTLNLSFDLFVYRLPKYSMFTRKLVARLNRAYLFPNVSS